MQQNIVIRLLAVCFIMAVPITANQFYTVRLESEIDLNSRSVQELRLDFTSEKPGDQPEIVADQALLDKLTTQGINYTIVQSLSRQSIPDYLSNDDVNTYLQLYDMYYPFVSMVQIGNSTQLGVPIYALKISDNPDVKEDETVVWIDGVHHAREPMGMMSCLKIIDYLITGYGNDALATDLVNELEIWIVPVINPEGYEYFIDSTSTNPWWRKNLLDNNSNGVFDYDYDGVDLNRNYDCNWQNTATGDSNPGSWVYRGPGPFSETELQAKRDLVLDLRPISAITYHSYGQILYYSIGVNGHAVPETDMINTFALGVASRIPGLNGGTYGRGPDYSSEPMSYHWMYQVAGCWEMLIETGTEFVPGYSIAQDVADDNLGGAVYLLERSLEGPGIRGHVRSAADSSALDAIVKIDQLWDPDLTPRRTEPAYGRFNRFANPGTYSLEITATGYDTVTVSSVVVDTGWSDMDVYLTPSTVAGIDVKDRLPSGFELVGNYPNPFNPATTIVYNLPEQGLVNLSVFDLRGNVVATLVNEVQAAGRKAINWKAIDESGMPVGTGVYLYRIQAGAELRTGKMVLLK